MTKSGTVAITRDSRAEMEEEEEGDETKRNNAIPLCRHHLYMTAVANEHVTRPFRDRLHQKVQLQLS